MNTPKLTAEQFLEKYPESKANENCLTDIACPNCGNRDKFRVQMVAMRDLEDGGTVTDTECYYDEESHCTCSKCEQDGTMADFTFEGLDDLINEAAEDDE